MASTTLDFLYIHLASDPATFITFDLDAASARVDKLGAVYVGANGRRRAILTEGRDRVLSVALDQVDRSTVATLLGWIEEGRTLLYRDPRGRAAWGVVLSISITEVWPDSLSVSFEFREVTYSEEV